MKIIKGFVSAFAVLALGLTVCPSEVQASPTRYYGYIVADFTCTPAYSRQTRIRTLSQVITWCATVSGDAILNDEMFDAQNAARMACSGELSVTNAYLYPYSASSTAQQSLANDQYSTGFSAIVNFYAGDRYMNCN